ncbi:FeoA family protein [Candidatus Oleimmundimicrobium sp.]|uniref:FeoA family protein n=1 Tax=Candidatus Oleimmundimicrobium sp. TaxID=3060597 RepID=UPI00271C8771|nr:FeoA family protein [Candidatus Oleimmundimicrobium sp.]MDO8886608.1 FeoA family protein [Candidatus Oleimmundimicrobium sp.]
MVSLVDMKINQTGIVIKINGGAGLVCRLEALDVRVGKKITKLSSMIMRGPIVVKVNGCQVAVGRGMAKKIMVEVDG